MTSSLLVGSAIQREIKNLTGSEGDLVIAVAYWGKGGGEETGVLARFQKNTRILCDLFSGCCNPQEMRKLVKHAEVRTLDGLHAKVWCTSNAVVIGSANASSNGLGLEGRDTRGNVEACAFVADPNFARSVRDWFDKTWNGSNCLPVDDDLIDEAKPIWEARRSGPLPQSTTTLMEALSQPDRQALFEHVRILAYDRGKLNKKQEHVADAVLSRDYPPGADAVWKGEYPFYMIEKAWKVTPGDIYLDFESSRDGGKFTFYGIYQVRENPNLKVEGQEFVLCDPLLDLSGIRLSKSERSALCSDVRKLVAANDWKTDESGNYLDMPLIDFLASKRPGAETKTASEGKVSRRKSKV